MELDENGIVQYSNNPVIVKGQKLLSELPEKEGYAAINQEGYKIMAYRSSIGYVNAIALPENTYQKEMNMWRLKLVVIILAAFGIFSSSVFYLYRLVCKPLNQFQKQMIQVGNGSLQEAEQEYGIKEFDDLMHEVEQMKEQIRNLIDDVVEKEKSIQRTEYEKLLYQINPHFLLNTLNSVQWMARMSRQDNITEFVQRLKRLLSYNLGKEGMQTTLRTEIDIVKDYIALEQMRYDFVIEMNVEEGRYLEQPTVRMLLQPLVENAIRYGLGDDEKITIQVFEDNIRGLAIITILDSGNGLTQEEINQINEPFDYDVKKMQHGNKLHPSSYPEDSRSIHGQLLSEFPSPQSIFALRPHPFPENTLQNNPWRRHNLVSEAFANICVIDSNILLYSTSDPPLYNPINSISVRQPFFIEILHLFFSTFRNGIIFPLTSLILLRICCDETCFLQFLQNRIQRGFFNISHHFDRLADFISIGILGINNG